MATTVTDSIYIGVPNRRISASVPAGETSPWYLVASEGVVRVKPGGGGTMSVQLTSSPESVVVADNVNSTSNSIAETWTLGTVSTISSLMFKYATAIRFIATTQIGLGEIST